MARMQNFILFCLACFILSGCNHYAFMETATPNIPAARFNAELAISYLKRGDTAQAQAKLRLALAQAPSDPLVLDTMAYYYEVTGNIDLASSYYAGAMIQAPESGTIMNNYGAFLCRQGYYSTSIPFFIKAAKTHYAQADHAYANARYCASLMHHELGEHTEYAYYNRLLWKSPNIPTNEQP